MNKYIQVRVVTANHSKYSVAKLTTILLLVPTDYTVENSKHKEPAKGQTMYMSDPKPFLPSTEAVSTLSFKSNHVLPLYSPRNIIIL